MENRPLRIGHVVVVSVKLCVQAQIFHVDSAVLCRCSWEIPDLSAAVIIIYILHFLALFFQLLFITQAYSDEYYNALRLHFLLCL